MLHGRSFESASSSPADDEIANGNMHFFGKGLGRVGYITRSGSHLSNSLSMGLLQSTRSSKVERTFDLAALRVLLLQIVIASTL